MRLADYVSQFLVKQGVRDIFMLTGYGAMYLNDAIKISGIKYFTTRNEATAPMMAEAYARLTQKVGVVCVTAGPGCTNAVPGLAEAYVDSAPILILSGQVERNHTVLNSKIPNLRTFGTAEINIIPIVEPLTKFAAEITDPMQVRYLLEKAFFLATTGRPGPVWLSVPLDIQNALIDESTLDSYIPEASQTSNFAVENVVQLLKSAKKPLIVAGHGIRQSGAIDEFLKLIDTINIPVIFSRLGQDIVPHQHRNIIGHGGIKGQHSAKKIMQEADVVLSLGCRLSVQFVGMNFEYFNKDAKIIAVDIDNCELEKPGVPIHLKILANLRDFLPSLNTRLFQLPDYQQWLNSCSMIKKEYPIEIHRRNPIDLYYFMSRLNEMSNSHHVITTDAGSNYYVGGQVFTFDRGQREITSGAFAAMGLSIPLSIGCAVAQPKSQILAVTGDGSLELNIQELKTVSHYNFNIKIFVINNGGYVSMKKWQDDYFDGRRIDDSELTGVGTLDLKKIADAFDIRYDRIDDYRTIDSKLQEIMSDDSSLFVEVVTDNEQRIINA